MQDINHASNTSILSKGHHPLPTCVTHPLIVNTSHILLEHGIEQVHVVWLGLDCVGEEAVGLVGDQGINWNLSDLMQCK